MADAKGHPFPDPDTELPPGEEPVIVWGTVIKDKTEDDMFEVDPKYVQARLCFNLRTVRFAGFYNKKHKKYHGREVIDSVDPIEATIPTEILDIEFDK